MKRWAGTHVGMILCRRRGVVKRHRRGPRLLADDAIVVVEKASARLEASHLPKDASACRITSMDFLPGTPGSYRRLRTIMRTTALLCAILPCIAAAPARTGVAATLYVNAVTGNDAAPGTSVEASWKTIAHAAARSRPGDTVLVAPGVYPEQVLIAGFPDATQRTVFRAEPAGQAILAGQRERVRFSVRRPKVCLAGFVCRGSREHAIEFGAPAHDAIVDGCTLLDNELDGVFFNDCRDGRVQNSIIARNGRRGVWFRNGRGGVVVACTILSNRQADIALDDASGAVVFDNILAASSEAMHLSSSSLATLRSDHNLFEGAFIASVHGKDMLATRNAGTLADWREISGQDRHSINAEPLLAAPGKDDFAPQTPPQGVPSPALQSGLRAATFAGVEAPSADLTGHAAWPAVGALWADKPAAAPPSFAQLTLPDEGSLSVVIRDRDGQIVRTLLSGYPVPRGPQGLFWDGRDNLGQPVPAASYRWEAIAHNVHGVDDGSVGNNGQPPYGNTRYSHGVWSLAVAPDGNLYQNCFWDEAGHDVRRFKTDGTPDWTIPFYQRNVAGGLGTAVATDGRYVFAALARQTKGDGGARNVCDHVRRLDAATGAPANFGGAADNLIVVNAEPKSWLPHQRLGTEDSRRLFGVRGLALDATRLWVANYTASRMRYSAAIASMKWTTAPARGGPVIVGRRPTGGSPATWSCGDGCPTTAITCSSSAATAAAWWCMPSRTARCGAARCWADAGPAPTTSARATPPAGSFGATPMGTAPSRKPKSSGPTGRSRANTSIPGSLPAGGWTIAATFGWPTRSPRAYSGCGCSVSTSGPIRVTTGRSARRSCLSTRPHGSSSRRICA